MRNVISLLAGATFALVVTAGPAMAQQHAAVGADKCAKMCHKVQFESWSKTKHATATGDKRAECETCHGNGADHMKLSVHRDPVKAKAAGLVPKPDEKVCAKCHKPGEIKGDMMSKVHAKKPKA